MNKHNIEEECEKAANFLGREKYERLISEIYDLKDNTPRTWIEAARLSRDPFFQNHYIAQLKHSLNTNPNPKSYFFGIIFAQSSERDLLEKQLTNDMISHYPVFGRFVRGITRLQDFFGYHPLPPVRIFPEEISE